MNIDPTVIAERHKGTLNVEIEEGELKNYVAGMPFPLINAHDPQVGEKTVWNFRHCDRGDSEEYWVGVRSLTATGALDRT